MCEDRGRAIFAIGVKTQSQPVRVVNPRPYGFCWGLGGGCCGVGWGENGLVGLEPPPRPPPKPPPVLPPGVPKEEPPMPPWPLAGWPIPTLPPPPTPAAACCCCSMGL